jgi:membrane peptidoglycan carboxypeptidase
MLAGIPNAPAVYQLSDGYDLAKQRQEWVLQTMVNNSYITKEEMKEALVEDVHPITEQQSIIVVFKKSGGNSRLFITEMKAHKNIVSNMLYNYEIYTMCISYNSYKN